jgi:hypothetical protein
MAICLNVKVNDDDIDVKLVLLIRCYKKNVASG